MNVILQSVMWCSPFYNLFLQIVSNLNKKDQITECTSTLESFIELTKYFELENQHDSMGEYSKPFVNVERLFDHILREFNPMKQHQDCQEFLSLILDKLHSELMAICKHDQKEETKADLSEWTEVGTGNKKMNFNNNPLEVNDSPIHEIFGGMFKNEFSIMGSSKCSVTFQPFFCINLDITPVRYVNDSLEKFFAPEIVDDFRDEDDVKKKAVHTQIIEKAPLVLILHVKRFVFSNQKVIKINDHITFEEHLKVPKKFFSTQQQINSQKEAHNYQLFSVIMHHGKQALRGHYTCFTKDSNNQWIYYDDRNHKKVNRATVFAGEAYVLFYSLLN